MTPSQSTDDLVRDLKKAAQEQLAYEASIDKSGPYVGKATLHSLCDGASILNLCDTIERLQADLAARDKTIETLRAMLGTKIDAAHAAGRATIEAARSEGVKP